MRARSCPQRGPDWGWRDQPFSVSALDKSCYFSCHVCWGPAQVCFSCRKAGRPIWNTHNSHVINDDLAQRLALAPWQLKGTGWASPAASTEEQGKGGRMRDSYLLRPHRPPSILFPLLTPPSRDFWLRLTQSPARRGPCGSVAASTFCPPLPLTECVRKHPTLRRGKSASAEIHAAA